MTHKRVLQVKLFKQSQAMSSRVLVIAKPDAVEHYKVGFIISSYEKQGWKLVDVKMVPPNKTLMEQHYAEHSQKSFYPGLIEFMVSGPVVAMILEHQRDGVQQAREIMKAVRFDLFVRPEDGPRNYIHASDSLESAEREIEMWFGAL